MSSCQGISARNQTRIMQLHEKIMSNNILENSCKLNRRPQNFGLFSTFFLTLISSVIHNLSYTRVGNVCPGWPVYDVKCLWSRVWKWGRERSHSHEPFYIWFLWCDLNLVIISLLVSKCQHFILRGLQFHFIKRASRF